MHGTLATRTRAWWALVFVGILVVPATLALTTGRELCGEVLEQLTVHTGLLAFGLVVLALLLAARLPSLVASLGIERLLRSHRLVAVGAVALAVVHLALVLVGDPRGFEVLDVRHTTPAARAATTSTLALGGTVGLALLRRRRQPRYEGWRLVHLALALLVFGGAWLHVWWLRHLGGTSLFAGWFVLMAVTVAAVVVRRWLWVPLRARRRSYVVQEVTPAGADAVTVAVSAHEHDGIPFRPGQFAWLKVGSSPFGFEDHPFSISSTAHAPHRKEFTIKALGDFSELVAGLRPGRRVFVDGAYGSLTTEGLDRAPGFVFIAGGIGVTPMLSMIRTLADRRDRRPHLLFLGARTPGELLLREELGALREHLDLRVVDVVEQAPDPWSGESGRVDAALLGRRLPNRSRRHLEYFVCGPPPMVLAVSRHLRALGVPARRIHTERFEVV